MSDAARGVAAPSGRRAVVPSSIRRAIARRMVESKTTIPHFYVATEIEMDALLRENDRLSERHQRLSVTAFLLRAAAVALTEHPTLNATWAGDVIEEWDEINIGVAIALDDGLIAPALLDCRDRDVVDLAAALGDLVARSKTGKLRAPEIADATFTVSNLGMLDVSSFTAIITPPQVAILATARTFERPVVREGKVVIRRIMTATLSCDHRVTDGVGAASFLASFKGLLEAPESWIGVQG